MDMSISQVALLTLSESTLLLLGFSAFLLKQLKKSRNNTQKLAVKLAEARSKSKHILPPFSQEVHKMGGSFKDFIKKELSATKTRFEKLMPGEEMNVKAEHPLEAQLVALRGAFLEAEKSSLGKEHKNRQYWKRFDELLKNIVTTYTKNIDNSDPESKSLKIQLEKSLEKINCLEESEINHLIASENLQRAQREIKLLEKYRDANISNVRRVKELLNRVSELQVLDGEAPASQVITSDNQNDRLEAILSLADEQKQLIIFLKKEIEEIRSGNTDNDDITMSRIDNLNYQLIESERCIETLEGEVTSLNSQLKSSNDDGKNNNNNINEIVEHLIKYVELLKKEASPLITGDDNASAESAEKLAHSMQSIWQHTTDLCHRLGISPPPIWRSVISTSWQPQGEKKSENKRFGKQESPVSDIHEKKISRLEKQLDLTRSNANSSAKIISYARELVPCTTVHEVAETLLNAIISQKGEASIMVCSEGKTVFRSSKGIISPADKSQLKGLATKAENKVTHEGDNVIINYPSVRMKIHHAQSKDETDTIKDFSVTLSDLTTLKVELLSEEEKAQNQHKILVKLIKTTQKHIRDINIHYQYQSSEGKKILSEVIDDVNLTLSTIDMAPQQEKRVEKILGIGFSRFGLLYQSAEIVDKGFVDIIKHLDKAL